MFCAVSSCNNFSFCLIHTEITVKKNSGQLLRFIIVIFLLAGSGNRCQVNSKKGAQL